MKVLLIGAFGQLGRELAAVFANENLVQADLADTEFILDIRDAAEVERAIVDSVRPDLVVNTAAFHNVPACETDPATAFAVNATGARNVAMACRTAGARLVHISTDYVFGDGWNRPLRESDPPAPLNTYGASKLAGEHLVAAACPDHLIVRTAALFGPAPCRAKEGRNFVDLMLHLAETRGEVRVVTDEFTSPTYTVALARQVDVLARRGEPGLYHACCHGVCSWYAFAEATFACAGLSVDLQPATRADFPSEVRRPAYSALANARLAAAGLDLMPAWQDALAAHVRGDRQKPPHDLGRG